MELDNSGVSERICLTQNICDPITDDTKNGNRSQRKYLNRAPRNVLTQCNGTSCEFSIQSADNSVIQSYVCDSFLK